MQFTFDVNGIFPLVWPAVGFVAATAAALVLRSGVRLSLRRWPSPSPVGVISAAIRGPSLLWCVAAGLYTANEVALDLALLPGRWHARVGGLLEAVVALSVTMVLASVAGHAVARVSDRNALGGGATGLVQTTARAVVFAVGLLVLLSALGVQVTPILTALGVGGLAVALALQDTLANLFAGAHLLADKPIRVGDYVKIDTAEGVVIDIGWRSTRLRSASNSVVVTPNQTVAKATITNYSLPDSRISLGLKVSVEHSVDADRVETVLLDEVTQALGKVAGLLHEPPPGVSLIPGFGEYSLDFSIGYSVASFVDQYQVQHELRRRILRRLRREGIPLAIPARSVRVEGAPALSSNSKHGGPPGSADSSG